MSVARLVIWGAGGHGKVVLDAAVGLGCWDSILFADDETQGTFCGRAVVQPRDVPRGVEFVVAVGSNTTRQQLQRAGIGFGWKPVSVVHRAATIAESVMMEPGTMVLAGAVVNAGAVLERNVIVNSGAIIEHDCRIGESAHISPRAVLGGGVVVGELTQVGIGAVVLPGVKVGAYAMVGAGAVAVRDVAAGSTVIGVPARELFRKGQAS